MRLVIILILFINSVSVLADALSDAKLAIRARQYERVVTLLSPLAKRGDPEAQYQLAKELFQTGKRLC